MLQAEQELTRERRHELEMEKEKLREARRAKERDYGREGKETNRDRERMRDMKDQMCDMQV